jgi:hypothetical protein
MNRPVLRSRATNAPNESESAAVSTKNEKNSVDIDAVAAPAVSERDRRAASRAAMKGDTAAHDVNVTAQAAASSSMAASSSSMVAHATLSSSHAATSTLPKAAYLLNSLPATTEIAIKLESEIRIADKREREAVYFLKEFGQQITIGDDVAKAVTSLRQVADAGRALPALFAEYAGLHAAWTANQKDAEVARVQVYNNTLPSKEKAHWFEMLNAANSNAQTAFAAVEAAAPFVSHSAVKKCLQDLDAAMKVLNGVMTSATTQFGNNNPLSLFRTLIGDVKDLSFGEKHNIVELARLRTDSPNAHVDTARRCAAKVAALVNGCDTATRVYNALCFALCAGKEGDLSALLKTAPNAESLDRVYSAFTRVNDAATNDAASKSVNRFISDALGELIERTRDGYLRDEFNEATIRVRNNRLFTNAFLCVGAMMEREWATAEQLAAMEKANSPLATLNTTKTSRKIDEMVAGGDTVVFAAETMRSSHSATKKKGDCNRVQLLAVANVKDELSYFFGAQIVDYKITVTCTILLFWLVLLEVPLVSIDLAKPQERTFGELFDYLRVVAAMSEVMKSNKWPALGTLGDDGANGTAPHHDGGDGKNDGDARVRLMQNGALADSAKTPSAQYTPSGKKSMVMEGKIASSSEDFDDGSAAYVFVGAERVLKAYSAARGSSLAVQAANEVRAHQLLALHAPSAVMPLLDVAMDVSYYSPQHRCLLCCYPAVVITTPRANGVQVDWSTVDGGELAVRGEQLLVAVSDMVACGVVHCDIKPSNLVVHDGIVRLIDFGLSYPFDVRTGRSPLVVPCGTPRYVAPEVERARAAERMMKVTPAVDVFSVGRVLGKAASVVERCAPLRRLIERMTAVAPEERPNMRAVLAEWRTSVAPALVEQQAMEVARAAEEQALVAAMAAMVDVVAEARRARRH